MTTRSAPPSRRSRASGVSCARPSTRTARSSTRARAAGSRASSTSSTTTSASRGRSRSRDARGRSASPPSGATGPCCRCRTTRALPPPRLQVGFTPIVEAPALAKELRPRRAPRQGRRPQPDGVLQGPRERRRRHAGALARARARSPAPRPATRRRRSPASRPRPGCGRSSSSPPSAPGGEGRAAPRLRREGASSSKGPTRTRSAICQAAAAEFGWYNRNCAINPYLVEGKKTCGLEIARADARRTPPDVVTVALGDGCTTAGIWKGLVEMKTHGVLDRLPRILAVQAEGAAPLARTFARGDERIEPVEASTLADSINVGAPRNGIKALRAVRASGGAIVTASDEAILAWIPRLARATGVFAEPTGVAALAGLEAALREGPRVARGARPPRRDRQRPEGHAGRDALRPAPDTHSAGPRRGPRGTGEARMIHGPTYAEMRDPGLLPAELRRRARIAAPRGAARPRQPLQHHVARRRRAACARSSCRRRSPESRRRSSSSSRRTSRRARTRWAPRTRSSWSTSSRATSARGRRRSCGPRRATTASAARGWVRAWATSRS